jgi:pantothenate kinase-related protein Tda10
MARARRATDRSPRRRKQPTTEALAGLNLNFETSPTVWQFLNDDSFVRGLMGPVGSGKTFASLAEVMLRAVKQARTIPRECVGADEMVAADHASHKTAAP